MKTLFLAAVVLTLCACGPELLPASPFGDEPALTNNDAADGGPADSGTSVAPVDDGGQWELDGGGQSDASPCPALTRATAAGCVPDIQITLSGTAAAVSGDTLYAGTGQQPVLQASISSPVTVGAVTLSIWRPDGGPYAVISPEATRGDAGIAYLYEWSTAGAPEGNYSAQAAVAVGDAGFLSNIVQVVVDRTPPVLTFDLGLDAGLALRNFQSDAVLSADDPGGSGTIDLSLSGIGQSVRFVSTRGGGRIGYLSAETVSLGLDSVTRIGEHMSGHAAISGLSVPFDLWSTAVSGKPLQFEARATDLAGNTASQTVQVSIYRVKWSLPEVVTSQPALDGQGQVLWVGSSGLNVVSPTDGSSKNLQSAADPFDGASVAVDYDSRTHGSTIFAAGTVASGNVVLAYVDGGLGRATAALPEAPTNSLIVTSPGTVLFAAADCSMFLVGPNGNLSSLASAPGDCSGGRLALNGDDVLLSSLTTWQLSSFSSNSIEHRGSASGQLVASVGPVLSGNALFSDVLGLAWCSGPKVVVSPGSPTNIASLTATSGGEVVLTSVSFADDGNTVSLMKLDGSGDILWQRVMPAPSSGPVLTSDGDIYIVDGAQSLRDYDADGDLKWASPAAALQRDEAAPWAPVFDDCLQTAYLGGGNGLSAVVLDAPGLDLAQGAWPMPGHDVFQTGNGAVDTPLDCSNHL